MVAPDIGAVLEKIHRWQRVAENVGQDARPARRRMQPTFRRMARNEAAFTLLQCEKGNVSLSKETQDELRLIVARNSKLGKQMRFTHFEDVPHVKSPVTAALME